MTDHKDNIVFQKSKAHIIIEIIEYIPSTVVSRTIIKKTTGNISVSSFDSGEELKEKTSHFDTYIQIIDGTADLFINKIKYKLGQGNGIKIPAHSNYKFNAKEPFTVISTIINNGNE